MVWKYSSLRRVSIGGGAAGRGSECGDAAGAPIGATAINGAPNSLAAVDWRAKPAVVAGVAGVPRFPNIVALLSVRARA
ncbi:hypothetical protein METY_2406 [Methylopila sp. Yamaguchi]|nr:hypothetical protein METY_2406 [Methylopila sp. Yamaguchi]